jgi:hypothetical protein
MKATTFLFGACALLFFPIEMAVAGPCTAEIESLTKLLASRDAGAGPTAGPVGTTTGQHPPTSAMGAADPSTAASAAAAESATKPQHPPTAAMNQATQGGGTSPPAGGAVREHPPTAAMSGATQGGATSPQDVQSQSRGGPTRRTAGRSSACFRETSRRAERAGAGAQLRSQRPTVRVHGCGRAGERFRTLAPRRKRLAWEAIARRLCADGLPLTES